MIRGGIKINVRAAALQVEIACRVSFGTTPEDIKADVGRRLAAARLGDMRFEHMPPLFDAMETSRDTVDMRTRAGGARGAGCVVGRTITGGVVSTATRSRSVSGTE